MATLRRSSQIGLGATRMLFRWPLDVTRTQEVMKTDQDMADLGSALTEMIGTWCDSLTSQQEGYGSGASWAVARSFASNITVRTRLMDAGLNARVTRKKPTDSTTQTTASGFRS